MPDPHSLDSYAEEVCNGLPHEKDRLDAVLENQAFFDLDAERYIPMRDAESAFDYAGRPKRSSGFTREVVEVLCEHLYAPGRRGRSISRRETSSSRPSTRKTTSTR